MPSKTKSNHVITTKAALEQEFQNGGWEKRLSKCQQKRVDKDFELALSARYRRQELVEHYEGDLLVAFTIEYTMHEGSRICHLKMLLINEIRNIAP